MALDRLVSAQDYADFARTFAGIGKAAAARLDRRPPAGRPRDDRRRRRHSDRADLGSVSATSARRCTASAIPYLPDRARRCASCWCSSSAPSVRIHPDYLWEAVEPQDPGRAARRRSASSSGSWATTCCSASAIAVIQAVAGVDLRGRRRVRRGPGGAAPRGGSLPRRRRRSSCSSAFRSSRPVRRRVALSQLQVVERPRFAPAQLAYLAPEVPDTLILQELKPMSRARRPPLRAAAGCLPHARRRAGLAAAGAAAGDRRAGERRRGRHRAALRELVHRDLRGLGRALHRRLDRLPAGARGGRAGDVATPHGRARNRILIPRREVANTLALPPAQGHAGVARSRWPTTSPAGRRARSSSTGCSAGRSTSTTCSSVAAATADLRDGDALDLLDGPFDAPRAHRRRAASDVASTPSAATTSRASACSSGGCEPTR